ncbi:MAG: hypothetical protein M1816_007850 [Peltula sp. TS41687]|nr:MAG: hypothetical protein M1816_007850 [Peltula sp. TS41687]
MFEESSTVKHIFTGLSRVTRIKPLPLQLRLVQIPPGSMSNVVRFLSGRLQKQLPDIIDRLPTLQVAEDGNLQVVLLVTPSLVELFHESSNFLGSALRRIFSQLTRRSRSSVAECDLLVAVVDRLPGLRAFTAEQNQSDGWAPDNGAEGISVLVASSPLEYAADMLSQADPYKVNTTMSSRVSFLLRFKDAGNVVKRTVLDVPLANTFLQIGREFTWDASRWKREIESDKWVRSCALERPGLQVKVPEISIGQQNPRPLHIPAIPLTVPRRIADIYGNILRRLQTDGKGDVPGSQELESRLEAYFSSQGWTSRPTDVWALILPQGHIQKDGEKRLTYHGNRSAILLPDAEDVLKSWSTKNTHAPNQLSELIQHGASLYRILSGGGGWGRKQGLLSLDPDTGYSQESETLSSSSMEGEEFGGVLPKVAAPGDYVQFFVSSPALVPDHEMPEMQSDSPPGSELSRRSISFVFGVTESTMDAFPCEKAQPQSYVTLDGCFGALSGQGVVVSMDCDDTSTGSGKMASSKIDVPYSTFSVQLAPEEMS